MDSPGSQGNASPTHDVVANDEVEKSGSVIGKGSIEYATAQNHSSGAVEEEAVDVSLPLNWPLGKKIYNMAVPSLLCLVGSLGISLYTPSIPDVMKDFHVSQTVAILPLTTFVLGLSFGPMISASISESLGRLGTYRIALPLSMLFTLGAGFTQKITEFIMLRFFASLFGGAPFPVSAGTATDLVRLQNRAIVGIALLYPTFLGPAIGPIIGGFVA